MARMENKVSRLIHQYADEVHDALQNVPEGRIMEGAQALLAVHRRRGTVFVLCPPEESDSVNHFVRELASGIGVGPFAFRLVRLYGSPAQVVAWQNDWAYEDIYAEQMRGVIRRGDAVIAISRRGENLNMVRALQAARRAGATTIAIVGYDGGLMKDVADIVLHVPAHQAEQVEDAEAMLEHVLCITLRRLLGQVRSEAVPSEAVPAL